MIPSGANDRPVMSPEEYELLNEYLSAHFGLSFPDHKKEILESRLAPRLRELKLTRFTDYYILLQYSTNGTSEIRNLARLVTNNETYFFRETHQFDALFSHALDELKARATEPEVLRVLVAGCSSGEEPYTFNIFAKENQFRMWGHRLEIQAFDLDADRVEQARQAEYGPSSMRSLDETQTAKYFTTPAPQRYALKPMFRTGIEFSVGNILQLETYFHGQCFDAVFCRNVLIYFAELALHQAIAHFAQCLRPGGLLFLGHSESIIGVSKYFEPIRLGDTIVYKRTAL